MSGVFADAAPDSWGRRLIERAHGNGLNEFEYLTLSDDACRQGALRFLDDTGEVIRSKAADAAGDCARGLSFVFDRLYVLRNQLVHGGSTWNGGVNRAQVRDGASILAFLMPFFVDLTMNNPQEDWGQPFYLVVE